MLRTDGLDEAEIIKTQVTVKHNQEKKTWSL